MHANVRARPRWGCMRVCLQFGCRGGGLHGLCDLLDGNLFEHGGSGEGHGGVGGVDDRGHGDRRGAAASVWCLSTVCLSPSLI